MTQDPFHSPPALAPGMHRVLIVVDRKLDKQQIGPVAPEKFSQRVAKELREQLAIIAGRAGEALLASMDMGRGEGVDTSKGAGYQLTRMEFSKSQAQEARQSLQEIGQDYYKHACDSFRSKDYHSAVRYAREAIRHDESRVAYHELLGDALVMNPHWRQRAVEAYRNALKIDEFNPDLVVKVGRLYAGSGLTSRAKAAFERALELQQDHEEAKAALKELRR